MEGGVRNLTDSDTNEWKKTVERRVLLVEKCCGGGRNPPERDTIEWEKAMERKATGSEVLWWC